MEKQILEGGADPVPGVNWLIRVTDPLAATNNYFTAEDGKLLVCGLAPGMYTVMEDMPEDYFVVGLIVNGVTLSEDVVYSFTWTADKEPPVIVFQNSPVPPPF